MTWGTLSADSPLATLIDYSYRAIESWLLLWRPILLVTKERLILWLPIARERLILLFLSAMDSLSLFEVSMVVSEEYKRVWSQTSGADVWTTNC